MAKEREDGAAGGKVEAEDGPAGWTASTFAAFGEPAYTAFWLNSVLTTLAVVMSITVQIILAFDLTGKNGSVGAVTFALGVPMLATAPFAGAVADRVPRRLLIAILQGVLALGGGGLGLLLVTDLISFPWVLVGAALTGVALSLLGPAQTSLMGQIMRAERLGNATALVQAGLNLARVAGPFLVAGLIALPAAGSEGAFLIVTLLLVAALAPLRLLPESPIETGKRETIIAEAWLGVRHITENPRLLRVVVGFMVITLLGFSYFVVLPRFVDEVLGAGRTGYGVLVGISSAGGLAGSLLVAAAADSRRASTYLLISTTVFGAALLLTGMAPSFAAALATMIVVGAAASAFQTLNNAVAFREADPAYLGRIVAVMNIAWSLTNLAGLPVGLLADRVGERAMLAGVGVSLCVATGLLAVWGRGMDGTRGRTVALPVD